jgi:hypothetical protein
MKKTPDGRIVTLLTKHQVGQIYIRIGPADSLAEVGRIMAWFTNWMVLRWRHFAAEGQWYQWTIDELDSFLYRFFTDAEFKQSGISKHLPPDIMPMPTHEGVRADWGGKFLGFVPPAPPDAGPR